LEEFKKFEEFKEFRSSRSSRSSGIQEFKRFKEFRSSGVQEFRSSGVQEFRSSGVQEFRERANRDQITSKNTCLGLGFDPARLSAASLNSPIVYRPRFGVAIFRGRRIVVICRVRWL
jgi:hypothetical protein